jgi:acyl dehydratase
VTRGGGLGAIARLLARGVRARGGPAPDAYDALPPGRFRAERGGIPVDAAAIRAYAGATGGDHLFAFYGEGAVAPPFLSSTWEPALVLELLSTLDPPVPAAPLIHLSTESVWARPLRPGDAVRCAVELVRVDAFRQGLRFTVLARNTVGTGRVCSESTSRFLLRAPNPDAAPLEREPEAPDAEWVELVRWQLRGGEGRRYARVSGDWNPIHLWPLTARPFGFARPILHGYATAARTAHTLVDLRMNGDPAALRRMSIRFRAPLELPATPALSVREDGGERWFRVASPDGRVHAEGSYGAAA